MKKDRSQVVLEWSKKIHKQMASGKSIAAWCREEGISYSTFVYWSKRIQKPISLEEQIKRSSFIECPQDSEVWIDIILEGAKLTLSRNFNRASLLFCLKLFGGH